MRGFLTLPEPHMSSLSASQLAEFAQQIKCWGQELGFAQVGIADVDLKRHERFLQDWLDNGYHGQMHYMQSHGMLRARPADLLPGTLRAICVRLDYLPPDASFAAGLADASSGYISRYALGRDYHKVLRNKLKKLGDMIQQQVPDCILRPFVDSAPVLEHALAEKAGIGWTGKHSLTLNEQAGSWFFLGELLISLPLPTDEPLQEQCGSCSACLTMCPTGAIVAPYVVDARKCISYLTIESDEAIPPELRPLLGNRIYGCDDCQLVCPWNREAPITAEADFNARKWLKNQPLLTLWSWNEDDFLRLTEGSPIRRIGYQRWRRNLAVALGNAPADLRIVDALQAAVGLADELLTEHIHWALARQQAGQGIAPSRQQQRLVRTVQKGLPRDA